MSALKTGPSAMAQWHSLVLEAEAQSGLHIPEVIEHYLVMTLSAFTTKTSISSIVAAIEFLHATRDTSTASLQNLRSVGDHCLILSGLFPARALRKNVSPEYITNIGKEAYYLLSFSPVQYLNGQEVFYKLFECFGDLTRL